MRIAEAAARGIMTNIIETMRSENMICMAYCRKAISAPTCISPLSMRMLPNQMMAMVVRFSDQHHHRHQRGDDLVDA